MLELLWNSHFKYRKACNYVMWFDILQILEANERKVGKVHFRPKNNGSPDLETKGLNRLLSTKIVKRKKSEENEPDGNDTIEIETRLEEDRYSSELGPQKRLEDSKFYATVEKGDGGTVEKEDGGYDSNSQQ